MGMRKNQQCTNCDYSKCGEASVSLFWRTPVFRVNQNHFSRNPRSLHNRLATNSIRIDFN